LPVETHPASFYAMSTVTEVENALEKFSPEQMREVGDWIAPVLCPTKVRSSSPPSISVCTPCAPSPL